MEKNEQNASPLQEYFAVSHRARLQRAPIALAHILQSMRERETSAKFRHVDHYALYIVRGGRGIHAISGHPYGIARGDVYVSPPGSVHSYHDAEALEADAFCFQIDLFAPDEIQVLRALPGFRDLFVASDGDAGDAAFRDHRTRLSPARHDAVQAMLTELCAELENPTISAPIVARGLFFRLLVFLARLRAERGLAVAEEATFHSLSLAEVLSYCEQHYSEPLSVSQLAGLIFLSPSRFSEVFKREMGVPPATYLRNLRLERAQTLLRETSMGAAEIARCTGFNDAAQFSKTFRSAFAMTPTQYRARFKAN